MDIIHSGEFHPANHHEINRLGGVPYGRGDRVKLAVRSQVRILGEGAALFAGDVSAPPLQRRHGVKGIVEFTKTVIGVVAVEQAPQGLRRHIGCGSCLPRLDPAMGAEKIADAGDGDCQRLREAEPLLPGVFIAAVVGFPFIRINPLPDVQRCRTSLHRRKFKVRADIG